MVPDPIHTMPYKNGQQIEWVTGVLHNKPVTYGPHNLFSSINIFLVFGPMESWNHDLPCDLVSPAAPNRSPNITAVP